MTRVSIPVLGRFTAWACRSAARCTAFSP